MEVVLLPKAIRDSKYWLKTNNQAILKRVKVLLKDIVLTHYKGKGNPEALKYQLKGYWSRRLNQEHRLIYKISANKILDYSLKGHYK